MVGAACVAVVAVGAAAFAWAQPSSAKPSVTAGARAEARREPDVKELQPGALKTAVCSAKSYKPAVAGCTPKPAKCGHRVIDDFASAKEVEELHEIASRGAQRE